MRKAKITGCVAETVGIEMINAAIGVAFKVGRCERYAQVGFPIETAKTNIDRNINQKSELLTEHLMKNVRRVLEHWNEGDADTTDLENIMRLKMPFLLRKAVNMEYFTQRF
jgi:t-SNARE complex subunit (syntaxin)